MKHFCACCLIGSLLLTAGLGCNDPKTATPTKPNEAPKEPPKAQQDPINIPNK